MTAQAAQKTAQRAISPNIDLTFSPPAIREKLLRRCAAERVEPQRKPLRIFDRFNRQVDVEIRPVEVVGRRPEDVDDLVDRCFGKPRKLLERHEELPTIEVEPEA